MKPLLAVAGGFVVSFGMFVAGLGVATYFLAVEPVKKPSNRDVTDLWAGEPRAVDPSTQNFVRLPAETPAVTAASAEPATAVSGSAGDTAEPPLDMIVTGALQPPPREAETRPAPLPAAHLAWCEDRYRSYSPETNSYRPYSGGQEPCVSPHMPEPVEAAPEGPPVGHGIYAADQDEQDSSLLFYAADGRDAASLRSSDHVSDCASRYRSYRAADNTYQPYGGGPRQQCR